MRKVLHCLAVIVIAAGAGVVSAQSTLSSPDSNKTDAHDRPIGKVNIQLPPSAGSTNPGELPPQPPLPPPPVTPPEDEDKIGRASCRERV